MVGLSTGYVLASELWQESTRMLLKPGKFTHVGDSVRELSQGWYLNCLGMLQFPVFWLILAFLESSYVSVAQGHNISPLTHTYFLFK